MEPDDKNSIRSITRRFQDLGLGNIGAQHTEELRMKASEATLLKWRMEPETFVRQCLGATPDVWQMEALQHWTTNQRMALKACKGPGKTCFEAWMAWNWLLTRPLSQVYAASITSRNLRDGLWKEMSLWLSQSPILQEDFRWTSQRIVHKKYPGNWFMSARSWERTADSTQQSASMAGIHGDYILIIVDEASEIPDGVVNSLEGALATGVECKMLIAGNPSLVSGPLFRACTRERDLWYVIEITGDPDDPKRAKRVSKEWAELQIRKWGRDNPWVLVNVFGKFPPASINALLGRDEIEAAQKRHYEPTDYIHAHRRMGVDVARFGDDSSCLVARQGLRTKFIGQFRNLDTNKLMPKVLLAINQEFIEQEFIDGTGGWGAGLVDALVAAQRAPMEVISNSKADDSDQFYNKRSEMYWRLAQWVKRGGWLWADQELIEELEAHTYSYQNDRLIIQEKELVKEQIGRSPDKADALALTFAIPESQTMLPMLEPGTSPEVARQIITAIRGANRNTDFDPIRNDGFASEGSKDFDPHKTQW